MIAPENTAMRSLGITKIQGAAVSRESLVHLEVPGTGKGVTPGVRQERIDQIGLLAAPDLVWPA